MIVTLTTDWGTRDFYLPALKGALLSRIPGLTIIDITHEIPPNDLIQASIILRNSYHHFPKGTVHMLGVGNTIDPTAMHLAIEYNGHYFLGADNGIFSLLLQDENPVIVTLAGNRDLFPEYSLFTETAARLLSGESITSLGSIATEFWQTVMPRPSVDSNMIRGSVIYVDRNENVITNISKELFEDKGTGREFTVYLRRDEHDLRKISKHYRDVEKGDLCALFNSIGMLEIAMNHGNAAGLLGLKFNDPVRIQFHDKENS